jgi:two-component system sensor histidine kinase KdpD
MRNKQVLNILVQITAPFILVIGTKLLLQPVKSFLQIQIIELIYLIPVMMATVLWGLTSGVLASIASFLVFNYFYIQPYNTLFVHQTQDVITLVIFLIVAIVLSQFIGKSREGMRLAKIREWEATKMYELLSSLAGQKKTEGVAKQLANHICQTFPFPAVAIYSGETEENQSLIYCSDNFLDDSSSFEVFPLSTSRGLEGEMRISGKFSDLSNHEIRLLNAYISQGSLALERIRLQNNENLLHIYEESDQLKSSLLNSVSHELRTPLSVIKASVSSLRLENIQLDTIARKELLATIEEETDELNLLVGNLLDMSRIEAGALHPQIRWNSFEEIAIGVAIKMRKQLMDHHLEMNFQDELPLIPIDYIMIERVLVNLISNSIKYSPKNTDIQIDAKVADDIFHVCIRNKSQSIPEKFLPKIFEKFFRMNKNESITGTGLGLSICKGIVDAHGGKIWAENEPENFLYHISLPITLNGSLPQLPQEEIND